MKFKLVYLILVLIAIPACSSINTSNSQQKESNEIIWQGVTYRAGDSVVVRQIAGTIKPKDTGISVEVYLSAGKTGEIVKGVVRSLRPSLKGEEPIQTALVRWDGQQWEGTDGTIHQLREFESTLHVDWLNLVK